MVTHDVGDLKRISDSVAVQADRLAGLHFTIDVKGRVFPSPQTKLDSSGTQVLERFKGTGEPVDIDATDQFWVLPPVGSNSRLWRKWERSSNEGKLLQEFYAFDGLNTVSWSRRRPGDKQMYSFGAIVPFEDTGLFEGNIYDRFWARGLPGMPEYQDPTGDINAQIMARIEWDAPVPFRFGERGAMKIHGYNRDLKVDQEIHVLEAPSGCVIFRSYSERGKSVVNRKYHVLEVKEFDGVIYPFKGSFEQLGTEYQAQIEYSFTVTNVRRAGDSERESWIPEWPSGTVVVDHKENQNFTIPFLEGEREVIYEEVSSGVPPSLRTSRINYILYFNVLMIAIIALVYWWKR